MTRSPVAAARLVKATVVTVALGIGMAFLPLGPLLALPFLVLPLAHLTARWGLRYAPPLIVVAVGLIFLLADLGMASLVLFVLVTMGVTLGWAIRRGWTFAKTLISLAAGSVVAFVLWGVTLWQVFGIGSARLSASIDASITNASEMYVQMGVSRASTELVSEQLRRLFDILPYLVPGLLVLGALLLAGCCIVLAWAIFPKLRDRVDVHQSLAGFRLHWSVAYASIIGLALIVFSRAASGWEDAVLYSGINILLMSQTLFFFQGLAVTHWFGKTRGLSRGSRGLMYVAAVVAQALLQFTGLLGLFDTWLDCRRRFALKEPGSGPAR